MLLRPLQVLNNDCKELELPSSSFSAVVANDPAGQPGNALLELPKAVVQGVIQTDEFSNYRIVFEISATSELYLRRYEGIPAQSAEESKEVAKIYFENRGAGSEALITALEQFENKVRASREEKLASRNRSNPYDPPMVQELNLKITEDCWLEFGDQSSRIYIPVRNELVCVDRRLWFGNGGPLRDLASRI